MALKKKLSKTFLDKLNQTRMREMDRLYIAYFVKLVLSVWVVGISVFFFYLGYSVLVYGSLDIPPTGVVFILLLMLTFFSVVMIVVGLKWYLNRRIPLANIFIINNAIGVFVGSICFNLVFREFTAFSLVNVHLFSTVMLVCLAVLVSVVLLSFLSRPINARKIEASLNVSFTLKVVPAFIFSVLFFLMLIRGYSYKESTQFGLEYENSNRVRDLSILSEYFGAIITNVELDTEILSSFISIMRYSNTGATSLNSRGPSESIRNFVRSVFSEESVVGQYLDRLDVHIVDPKAAFGSGYNASDFVGLNFDRQNINNTEMQVSTVNSTPIHNHILTQIRNTRETYVDIRYIDVKVSSFVIYVPMFVDDRIVGIAVFTHNEDAITSIINFIGVANIASSADAIDIAIVNDNNALLYAYNETFESITSYMRQERSSDSWAMAMAERYYVRSDGLNISQISHIEENNRLFNVQKSRPRNSNINILSIWETVIFKNRYNSVSFFEVSSIVAIIALIIYSIIVYLLIKMHQTALLKLGYSTSILAQNGGDLRMRMEVRSNDESSILAYGINRFLEKITLIINTLKSNIARMSASFDHANKLITENYEMSDSAVKEFENEIQIIEKVSGLINNAAIVSSSQRKQFVSVNDSIGTLLQTVTNINNSMENQATAINQTSASIHEMMSNISSVAQSAQKVNQFSKELVSDAKNGNDIGEDVMEAIQHIKEASTQITDITRVIQIISEQTNLLAMNAAIEAAHAGEQGKGFAIVADKIRKLAEDTNENSKIIGGIVQDVVDSVERTVILAIQSSDAIEKILDSSQSVSDLIGEITNANSELDLGRRDILSVLKNLNQITFSVQNFSNEQTDISEKLNSQILSVDKLAIDVGYAVDSVNNETGELLQSIRSVSSLVVGSKDKVHNLEDNMGEARAVFNDIASLVNVFITTDDDEDSENVQSENKKA